MVEGVESNWYSFLVQGPSLLITTLSLSPSKLLLEVTVNGCHCSLDMLGTFMNITLVGL